MHSLGGTGMEASCGVWWINGTELGNWNGLFFCHTKEGIRVGGPCIAVGRTEFLLGLLHGG